MLLIGFDEEIQMLTTANRSLVMFKCSTFFFYTVFFVNITADGHYLPDSDCHNK